MSTKTTFQEGLSFKTLSFSPKSGQEKKDSAIIVLQEWWGVNEQIKKHAQIIADNTNSLAIVPDLYKGKLGLSREEASHLMSNLDWKEALGELETLVDSLRKENRVKIASIGFCMGGAMSLALAARLSQSKPLAAAIACYGTPSPAIGDVSVIPLKTPVQGHFGKKDDIAGFSDPNAANSLERLLNEGIKREGVTGKEIAIYHYDGQGHAFLNNEEFAIKGQTYPTGDKDAQDLAWNRIFEFLKKYL
nr:14708_t:CDS:2 [Entrophospora candida]CAG8482716.1 13237_t:CDS:2 [Entrophospora candida]